MFREGRIKDVYEDGVADEFRKISELVEKFNHVSMDTEFPGQLYYPFQSQNRTLLNDKKIKDNNFQSNNLDNNYSITKRNVEDLKLIQVGITLSDGEGNFPEEYSTWQFNLNFDKNKDSFSPESIDMLESAGIDFKALASKGISPSVFAENLIPSGLLLNENVHWITFHGSYDFAYLLKNVTNTLLPEDEIQFMKSLETYFPNFYDVRYLINNNNLLWMKGSLSKIANLMDIKRLGSTHQAGSDSLVTSKLYFKLLDTYPEHIDIMNDKNKIFGLNGYEENDNFSISSQTTKASFNENFLKAYNYNAYTPNEGFSGVVQQLQSQSPNPNMNGNYNRMGINSMVGQNYPNQLISNSGVNNNMNMIRESNSPTKFNMVMNNMMNRGGNVINLQNGYTKSSGQGSSNNMMYYQGQNSSFGGMGQNFNNNGYNNSGSQGYNPQMNYNNNFNQNMGTQQMYPNAYSQQKQVGDYNNYMNQYYIQNGFKANNNNIATI